MRLIRGVTAINGTYKRFVVRPKDICFPHAINLVLIRCPLLLLEFLENDIEVATGATASALQVVVLELIRQFEV